MQVGRLVVVILFMIVALKLVNRSQVILMVLAVSFYRVQE